MTCGIYILRFRGTDKVYIGKSIKIEARYSRHLESFRAGIASKKMMQAFKEYGFPTYEVLCETSTEDIDKSEAEAIDLFNSVDSGFNSLDGIRKNHQMTGEFASNHLYDNDTYAEILDYLVNTTYTQKRIAEVLQVSQSVVTSISKLENHMWLEKYKPNEYAKLRNLKESFIPGSQRSAETLGIKYPIIVSPQGVEYNVLNVRAFANEHDLASSNLHSLLVGRLTSLKGWVIKGTKLKTYPTIKHISGRVVNIPYQGASKFAKLNDLNTTQLSNLFTGRRKEYNGWTIHREEV